ncbi:unnamed protein product [Paramecium primaurelia]|uniref:Tubby C-terminal domain-containing protein n=1 Tax=Paramecium primaurelia TaxID=5886 RepID=A0A8S1NB74_PARPR|nr:unnamed protein product [Paramecium primaurelia]
MNQNQDDNSSDDVIQFEDNEIIDFSNMEEKTSPKDNKIQQQEHNVVYELKNSSQQMLIQEQSHPKQQQMQQSQKSPITIKQHQKSDSPELQKFKDNNYTILQNLQIDFSLEQFLISPAPKGGMIQCRFYRASPKFTLFLEQYNNILLNAEKKSFQIKGSYKIYAKGKKEQYLGKIKGDFMGLKYLLYDNGKTAKKSKDINQLRKELGVIYYQPYEKKLRSIQSFIPQITSSGQLYEFKNQKPYTSIINNLDNVIELINRKPQWIPSYKAYGLNFYGRIFTSSVKNFILTERGNEIPVMLFGKNDDREFVLDFSYPLTPVQAFCIALSSMDHKFGCK